MKKLERKKAVAGGPFFRREEVEEILTNHNSIGNPIETYSTSVKKFVPGFIEEAKNKIRKMRGNFIVKLSEKEGLYKIEIFRALK